MGASNHRGFRRRWESEIAAAGATAYTVMDLACVGEPLPEGCAGEFLLWSRPSQDSSSNKTGSSVFDFEGDGSAEAVYGDECFLRVYNGGSGEVLFSGPRSSCTWHEMPIVADVGDFLHRNGDWLQFELWGFLPHAGSHF